MRSVTLSDRGLTRPERQCLLRTGRRHALKNRDHAPSTAERGSFHLTCGLRLPRIQLETDKGAADSQPSCVNSLPMSTDHQDATENPVSDFLKGRHGPARRARRNAVTMHEAAQPSRRSAGSISEAVAQRLAGRRAADYALTLPRDIVEHATAAPRRWSAHDELIFGEERPAIRIPRIRRTPWQHCLRIRRKVRARRATVECLRTPSASRQNMLRAWLRCFGSSQDSITLVQQDLARPVTRRITGRLLSWPFACSRPVARLRTIMSSDAARLSDAPAGDRRRQRPDGHAMPRGPQRLFRAGARLLDRARPGGTLSNEEPWKSTTSSRCSQPDYQQGDSALSASRHASQASATNTPLYPGFKSSMEARPVTRSLGLRSYPGSLDSCRRRWPARRSHFSEPTWPKAGRA